MSNVRPVDGLQTAYVRFRLVKIADTVVAGQAAMVNFFIACNGPEFANGSNAGSTVTLTSNTLIISQTCTLLQADTQVTLPVLGRSGFDGVGSRQGSTSFNLDFQCDANAVARVYITDITDQGNTGPVLVPAAGSTLAGVGVQLTSDGVPVTLAPNQAISQGGHSFPLVSPGSAQVVSIPLAAEYVQTATAITPGAIQAQAMVTIAYQ